jgi:hypothetical protein
MDEKRLTRIELKLDDISEHLGSIDVTLASQHVSLKDHIRRTTALETALMPVKTHVNRVEGALKLITLIATIAAIVEFILRK